MEDTLDDILTVELNGKEYPLEFPIDAVRAAKKKYGGMKGLLAADQDESMPILVAAGVVDEAITENWLIKNVRLPIILRQAEKIIAAFLGKTKTEFEQEQREKAEAKEAGKNEKLQLVK